MSDNALQQFQLLMNEIGPAVNSGFAVPVGETPSDMWTLGLSDTYTLSLRCLAEKRSLLVSIPLGIASSPAHFRTLLMFNGLYEETGGARFSLNGDEVTLSVETPLDDLTLEGLQTLIFNFVDSFKAWRELLRSEPGEVEPPSAPEGAQPGMRV